MRMVLAGVRESCRWRVACALGASGVLFPVFVFLTAYFTCLADDRPLRPATCQSVRMSFLALAPGVHTIEALTLTDVETQHALMLRFGRAFQLRCIRHCLRFTF